MQLELLTGPLTAAAQIERNHIREKTLQGEVTAAEKGIHGGRPKVIDDDSLLFARAHQDAVRNRQQPTRMALATGPADRSVGDGWTASSPVGIFSGSRPTCPKPEPAQPSPPKGTPQAR